MGTLSIAGLSFLKWLANRLSIEKASAIGGFIGRKFGPGTNRHKRALRNIRYVFPDYSEQQQDQIALGMWDNFGRTIAESLVLERIAADPKRVVLENPEELKKHDNSTKGRVFAGLHFGNWESTAIPALHLGLGLLGLYKPSKSEKFHTWLRDHRLPLYPGGLLPGNPQNILKITRHVKNGGSICLLADHSDHSGERVNFFGNAFPSSGVPAMLAVRFGAPLIAARVDRHNNANFSVHLKSIDVSNTGDRQRDITETTKTLQALFEQWISEDPEKWLWFYKRWPEAVK